MSLAIDWYMQEAICSHCGFRWVGDRRKGRQLCSECLIGFGEFPTPKKISMNEFWLLFKEEMLRDEQRRGPSEAKIFFIKILQDFELFERELQERFFDDVLVDFYVLLHAFLSHFVEWPVGEPLTKAQRLELMKINAEVAKNN